MQYVGLSGDHDAFLMRYCRQASVREETNGIEWACRLLSNDSKMPVSFTVSTTLPRPYVPISCH